MIRLRTRLKTLLLAAWICGFFGAEIQAAEAEDFERRDALAISQAAIGRTIENLEFTGTHNQVVRLGDYVGKPLVISLIYTSCYHICPATTQHLAKVVRKAQDVLGEESFQVITVGFDTVNDTADAMRVFAAQQSVDIDGWEFLSGDRETVELLADQLGFQYVATSSGFDHLIQASVLDADGRVFRQVYGIKFDTPHLVEPLKVLVFGEDENATLFDQITARVKLFCTVYDPASDSYQFDYSIFVGLFIGLVLGGVFIYVVAREWSLSRKASRA